MRLLLLSSLLILLILPELNAQSPDTVFIRQDKIFDDTLIYRTDTVIFESGMTKHILIGTTLLPSTQHQMVARGYGLWPINVTKTNCQGSGEEHSIVQAYKINSIINTDSSLDVDINIVDNCCYDFLCDVTVDSSGILHLIYTGYGTYCACDCCFGLTYHFAKWKDPDYKTITAVMIGDNRKTLKAIKN